MHQVSFQCKTKYAADIKGSDWNLSVSCNLIHIDQLKSNETFCGNILKISIDSLDFSIGKIMILMGLH